MTDPWYVTAFRSDYREVYPHRDVASARQEVAWILEQGLQGPVLDLCCGFGRHSVALAQAGLDVVGLDLSADLLRQLPELEGGPQLAGRRVRADARHIPFAANSFGGLVNLFSSFGYFGDPGDSQVLAGIARVLRPGGLAVLDLMNPPRIRDGLVPASRTERDGLVIDEERALLDQGRRVTKRVHITFPGGRQESWHEDVRMYDPEELHPMLRSHGLEPVEVVGSFAGAPFDAQAERQLVVARRV